MHEHKQHRLGRADSGAPPQAVWTRHDDERQEVLAETFSAVSWAALSDLERARAYDLVDGLLALRYAARVRTGD